MYCKFCGKHLNDDAKFCTACGASVAPQSKPASPSAVPSVQTYNGVQNTASTKPLDSPSGGYAVLCFFFPIVGLILYCVWHGTYPLRAHSCAKGGWASVITWLALSVFLGILGIPFFDAIADAFTF